MRWAPAIRTAAPRRSRLPVHISGLYNVEVITNFDGSLFENGATANNTGIAPQPLTVTVMPRPDLAGRRRSTCPQPVNAGGTFSVTYTVINQGSAATTSQLGRQGLSVADAVRHRRLDPDPGPSQPVGPGAGRRVSGDDRPGDVPDRYAGQVYVIVDVDANHVVDQWPNGTHNLEYQPIYVNPMPLPDLVVSNVVAPTR